jgi:hypothetical protein
MRTLLYDLSSLTSFMGTPNSIRILYNTSLLTESCDLQREWKLHKILLLTPYGTSHRKDTRENFITITISKQNLRSKFKNIISLDTESITKWPTKMLSLGNRACVGTWVVRTSWHSAQGRDSNGQTISYTGNILLCTEALTVILVIGGLEQNSGLGVEVKNSLQVLCSG